jgi:tetratricopeptide (TPR) repeat protein
MTREALEAAERLMNERRWREALVALDEAWDRTPFAYILRSVTLAALERYEEANDAALHVARASEWEGTIADALSISLQIRLDYEGFRLAHLTDAARALELARTQNEDDDDETKGTRGQVHLCRARTYARMRVRSLADRELAQGRELLGDEAAVFEAEGRVLLAFDERLAARDVYDRARRAGAEREGRLGLSRVATLLGDFGAARAVLDDFAWAEDDLEALRVRLGIAEAEQQWAEVVALYDRILAVSPHGMLVFWDRERRAAALYRSGDAEGAASAYETLAAGARDGRDPIVKQARRVALRLRSPDAATAKRARLRAFPTVAQLRNHCGPASCELYLRYFGVSAAQASIGEAILYEGGTGTAVYRMRRILEKAALVTRRIEAELPRIRALIDMGIPVIVEETYSQSGHVAVVIGYDDLRGVLEVQDPMTHAIRDTRYDELDELQDFTNAGGLIGVPRGDEARLAALDVAGILECRYIAATDEAYFAMDEKRFDDVAPLLDESTALRRDYELAWACRVNLATQRLDEAESAEHRAELHRVVAEALAIWPEDDWARRFAGRLAAAENRWDDARREYERARREDPHDPSNFRGLADANLSLGDPKAAREALTRAVELDPGDPWSFETLAYAALRDGDPAACAVLSEVGLAARPDNAFNHLVLGDLRREEADFEGTLAAYEKAVELEPGRATGVLFRRVDALERLGRDADAVALLAAAPNDQEPARVQQMIAECSLRAGDAEGALAAAKTLGAIDGALGAAFEASAHRLAGRLDEARSAIDRAIEGDVACARAHHERGLLLGDDQAEALRELALAVALEPDEPRFALDFGRALAASGSPARAAEHLVTAAKSGKLSEPELARAASIITSARGAGAALEVLRGLRQKATPAERRRAARVEARVLSEQVWAPSSLADTLRALHAEHPLDPFGLARAGADRFGQSIEDEAEGEALLRRSLATLAEQGEPDHPLPRRLLASLLLARGRADEVLALATDRAIWVEVDMQVDALVHLERHAEAEALIEAFERGRAPEGQEPEPAPELRFAVASGRHDFEQALKLAREAGAASGESASDARVSPWELRQFECLLALHRDEEAIQFAMNQGGDGDSLGRLTHQALLAGRPRAAKALAQLALRLDPSEAYALHTLGRIAELDNNLDEARAHYERAGEVDEYWHAWLEEMARLSITMGDAKASVDYAERAVARSGHTCFWAIGARAQSYLFAGDIEKATADAHRALRIGSVDQRDRVALDVWGVAALLAGDEARGRRNLARFLDDPDQSGPLDRQRIERLLAAFEARPR